MRGPVLGKLEPAVRKRIAASAAPVEVPEEIRVRALAPIERMLALCLGPLLAVDHNNVGGFERAVFVRTYWNSDNRSTNGPRWESTINDLYIGDSVAVGSTIEGSGTIANATIVNWARYHSLSNVYLNMFDSAVNSRVNDSTFYDSGTGPTGGEISLGQAIGSNNIIRDWDGSTLPSDSTYGAPAAPQ